MNQFEIVLAQAAQARAEIETKPTRSILEGLSPGDLDVLAGVSPAKSRLSWAQRFNLRQARLYGNRGNK